MGRINIIGICLLLCLGLSWNMQSQEQAINFEFVTIDNESMSLESLEGEVVYLSLWATWCKPCIQNFEKYYDFRETLKAEGVILLNINLDKDKSKYESFLSNNTTLNGLNAYPTDLTKLSSDYKISSIPEYHIIDKSGNYVYLSVDPDRDVLAEFKNWLKE